jgi:hypothetical protein
MGGVSDDSHCKTSCRITPEFMVIASGQYRPSRKGWREADSFEEHHKDLGQDPAGISFIDMVSSHQLRFYELAHHSLRMTKLHY